MCVMVVDFAIEIVVIIIVVIIIVVAIIIIVSPTKCTYISRFIFSFTHVNRYENEYN